MTDNGSSDPDDEEQLARLLRHVAEFLAGASSLLALSGHDHVAEISALVALLCNWLADALNK